jgi:ligand-binding sensor domain-containing protein
MNEGLTGSNGLTVHRMLYHRHGFFVVTDAGLFRWEPGRNRWLSLDSSKVSAKKIHALETDNDRTVFIGTDRGILKKEGGSGWTAVEPALNGDAPFIANALLWTDEHGLFAAGPGGLSLGRRQSKSLNWEKKNQGLPSNGTVQTLAQDPQRPSLLYAGTSRGLFVSQNGGDRWEPAAIHDEDAAKIDVRSIAIQPDGMLFIGTADTGVLVGINRLPQR